MKIVIAIAALSSAIGAIAALEARAVQNPRASSAASDRSVWDGVYTAAQQKRGAEIYRRECSTCHGETMRGGEGAPGLIAADFATSYDNRTVADLFDKIRQTMPAPPEQPGKLSAQENADVVAHILSGNGFPAGATDLPSDVESLKGIRITVKPAARAPTFNRDVASIFNDKCVTCHRPGEAAPMSLVTYRAARPWARAIRQRVASREMPPWFADRHIGRRMANDTSLTDAQIQTIVDWVAAGAPEGEGAAPPPPAFVEGWRTFKGRPPDAILEMPTTFDVPATGTVPVFTLWSPSPFMEDKFIEAVELRPDSVTAVHHSDVTARELPAGTALGRGRAWQGGPLVDFVPVYPDGRSYQELTGDGVLEGESAADAGARRATLQRAAFQTNDDNRLLFYVPGGGFQQFPPGAVKRISAGNALAWGIHYTPTGAPERDRHRLGVWFARTPHTHEVITKRIGEAHIIEGHEFVSDGANEFPTIPPFASDWRITAITPFQDDVTLYGLWPHMHLRGKDMTFIATYPDGREEVLLHVPRYDFRWQLQYALAEPVHLPAGSTIKAIGHYDNSARQKYNPAPEKPVFWSEQSADEMFNGWMELTIDRHVIAYHAAYTISQPTHRRVSLGVSAGPRGVVSVRNADGSLVAAGPIGASASFVEPWLFAPGQTITTDAAGADSGTVTLTVYDVPPDVVGTVRVDGPAVAVTTTQPGQNGLLTFDATAGMHVTVHVTGNRMDAVSIAIGVPHEPSALTSAVVSVPTLNVPAFTVPTTGVYEIRVDPIGATIGTLNVALTSTR